MEILSWFLLEAFAAMALLGLVVWWTWPGAPKENDRENEQEDKRDNDPKQ